MCVKKAHLLPDGILHSPVTGVQGGGRKSFPCSPLFHSGLLMMFPILHFMKWQVFTLNLQVATLTLKAFNCLGSVLFDLIVTFMNS